MTRRDVPDLVPVLSRGKHRSPRKGACFMELVSYLAGERWSDHPSCTHPLLAGVARLVNDYTSDAARPRLAGLIPSVIGLTSDDPRVDARIALRCATTALPVVAAERQRVLAVSIRSAEQVLAVLDGDGATRRLSAESRRALDQVPDAAGWSARFTSGVQTSPRSFQRYAAPSAVRFAVQGIAHACIPDPDGMMRGLLAGLIDDSAVWMGRRGVAASGVDDAAWTAACELTVRSR